MNTISVLHPYKYFGNWVFDDPNTGLIREAFVSGADTLIDLETLGIKNAHKGFSLLFSDKPFPGHTVRLNLLVTSPSGSTYEAKKHDGMEVWLCAALFKYFNTAPSSIFAQFKPDKHDNWLVSLFKREETKHGEYQEGYSKE